MTCCVKIWSGRISGLFLLLAAVLGSTGVAQAAAIAPETARLAVERWIQNSVVFQRAGGNFSVAAITPLRLPKTDLAPAFHVALAPQGYVVLGGDDRLPPVLAFSPTGSLNLETINQNTLRAMLVRSLGAWKRTLQSGGGPDAARAALRQHRAEWLKIIGGETAVAATAGAGDAPTTSSTLLVAPLLQTQWSQWNHFNDSFPADPQPGSGYDGRAPVGCMPVAGAQLARYYTWPTYGVTGHTDNDNNPANLISGNFDAHFGDRIGWSDMQDTYNPWAGEATNAAAAVSDIMYRLGVALNLDFGSFYHGGSSASVQSLARALNRCFFFERGTYTLRNSNTVAFDTALRNELLAGRPVPCAIPGHAAVADGLAVDNGADYFHMNYGLGGLNDGWFRPSAIPEGSVDSAIFGERPAFIPLLEQHGFVTNVTGVLAPAWRVAAARQADVIRYRMREGQFVATSFTDFGNGLHEWTDYSGGWVVESPGYGGGSCFRKAGEIGDFTLTLRDVIIPTAATRLQYNYKAILVADHVYVEVSTDRGETWQVLRHLTNTGYNTAWLADNISLAAYAGREVMVRFLYSFKSGTYYGANGGLWLDNVSLNNIQQMRWTVVKDNIAPGATNTTIATRLSGTYHFEVQAYNGTNWSAASPFVTMTVALDPALDVDGDGLANGWESAHYGGPTNGVAAFDSDGDGLNNLQEFIAGTHPNDAASLLDISGVAAAVGFDVNWPSVAGKTYTVWRAESLADSFIPVASNLAATPPANIFTDAAAPAACFYRISVP